VVTRLITYPGLLLAGLLLLSAPEALGQTKSPERRYGETTCDRPGLQCVTVEYLMVERQVKTKKGLQTRTSKVFPTWEKMWPDPAERDIVMKLNRMSTPLRIGYVLAVPRDMAGKTYMDFSPFPHKIQGHGENLIIYDPALLAWGAFDGEGNQLRWGPGVGGKNFCPDVRRGCQTPTGKFRVNRKGGKHYRSSLYPIGCKGAGCALMPWFVHFGQGAGFHHSNNVSGMHASHGCVRVFYDDAHWLNQEFADIGTKVRVRPYPGD
jgi:hypothetical protein